MKILIFSTAYLPFIGGAEVAVKEITKRNKDVGFDMITARMDKELPKQEKIDNINVYRLGIGWPILDKYWLAFWGHRFAKKLHKKNNYQAIWSIMASYGGFSAMFFKNKNPGIPFLLTLQEGDDLDYINKRIGFLKKWFKKIFTSADYIQAISEFLAKWAKNMGAKCKIEVVPNGVEIEKFITKKPKIIKNKGEKAVITVSRLVKKNGMEDLIRAMKNIGAKLLICGSGKEEKKLKKIVANLNLENKVIFLGLIEHNKLPEYLWSSDVFCRPSLSEGLGNVFLEAMIAGLPVIATPVGGIPDFLKEGKTGWFCQVRDPESIAQKIKYIFDDKNKEEVKRIVDNARQMVKEKYNWENIARKMNNIFLKITK